MRRLGEKNDPQRIAVDSKGNVYVTQPKADIVQQFGRRRQAAQKHRAASSICHFNLAVKGQEQIAVLGSRDNAVQDKGWSGPGSAQIDVIGSNGVLGTPVKLARPCAMCRTWPATAPVTCMCWRDEPDL
jgi:hypothetical protein